ncbi:MAG: response regulator transcription factor [Acidimicrobiia bacterium]
MTKITDARRRVLVVSADADTAAGVREALQASGEFVWCGWATDMTAVRRLARESEPDLVVTDVVVPGPGGSAVVSTLAASLPGTPLVVWTHTHAPDPLRVALCAGVHGYVVVDDGLAALADALAAAATGRLGFGDLALELMAECLGRPPSVTAPAPHTARVIVETASLHATAALTDSDTPLDAGDVVEELTHRELQVMSGLGRGLDNRTIGSQLGISVATVTGYVKRIREKLGVRSRGELIAMSARLGEDSAAAS